MALILDIEGLSKLNRGILNRLHALKLLHHLFTVLQIVGHIQNNLFSPIRFITNEDPTSSVGRQTVILKDCNMDGGLLAKFDADAEYLDEDMDFTFEDFEMPETFTMLAGME